MRIVAFSLWEVAGPVVDARGGVLVDVPPAQAVSANTRTPTLKTRELNIVIGLSTGSLSGPGIR
jgi:hypothetical protein